MTLSIRDPEVDRLARDLANRTGEPITKVVKTALKQYRATLPPASADQRLQRINELVERIAAMPVADPRSSKELLDDLYDEDGLPK
jgi:antitoxin VapB